ncbi:MAG: META domain-containing protein [Cryomorphaceae bacterium]|nr:META domain-containing protein [Cryomorphaceae bacterium]
MNKLLALGLLLCFSVACKKQNNAIVGEWEVLQIKKSDNSNWEDAPEAYLMTFTDKDEMNVRLEVNTCGSTYNACTCGNLNIDVLACTEACCDSEFAQTLIESLSNVESYEIDGDALLLKGKRSIALKRKGD